MRRPSPVAVDMETFGIDARPHYPPVPVGVAIQWPRRAPRYYAFGHATGNNATWGEAQAAIKTAYAHPGGVVMQNANFDLDVIETHLELKPPPWHQVHDTLFLLYLDDPRAPSLALKASAERLLGEPPAERDEVLEWLVTNQPVPGIKISGQPRSVHYAMKYLPFAPGELVGRYAKGDVTRTTALFKLLWSRIYDEGMLEAYNRERRLLPILLAAERRGIAIATERLARDVTVYEGVQHRLDAWLRKRLRLNATVNLDSSAQLGQALIDAKAVDPTKLTLTSAGAVSTARASLKAGLIDPAVTAVLEYRARLSTSLGTFMKPWLATARRTNGLIYTRWHQVRAEDGGGTRTGRLSSSPNFQNVPRTPEPVFRARGALQLPLCPLPGLRRLPNVRSYLVPFEGDVFIDRDYSQQEPRILGHFDGGLLLRRYVADPWIEFHDFARDELAHAGLHYERKPVKNTNFGLIYGQGVGLLAEKNGMAVAEAKQLKNAVLALYPGLKAMYTEMRRRAEAGEPIRTWGGRLYYCEPPGFDKKRRRWATYDYKLVNQLIQGSAADCTKEAIIRFNDVADPAWHLVLNVHDQLTVSVPRHERDQAMAVLREAMEGVAFDVPMLSEGSVGEANWGELVPYDKKGVRV